MDRQSSEPQRRGPAPARPAPRRPEVERAPSKADPTKEKQRAIDDSVDPGDPKPLPSGLGIWGTRIGLAALAVVAGIALIGGPGGQAETDYRNFSKHVEPLEEEIARTGDQSLLRRVAKSGAASFTGAMAVSEALDSETADVRAALQQGDIAKAQAKLASLQSIPEIDNPPPAVAAQGIQKPTLQMGMPLTNALMSGDADLYRLFLYDNCAEDGDIVDVYIDGQRFATVPIMHAGATITVPVRKGTTSTVELVGMHDGGGGITVAFRSSEGDYFTQRMPTGGRQTVAVITR